MALQGAEAGIAHQVEVLVNGFSVGSMNFSGQDHSVKSFNVPNAWLLEGNNDDRLHCPRPGGGHQRR